MLFLKNLYLRNVFHFLCNLLNIDTSIQMAGHCIQLLLDGSHVFQTYIRLAG